MPFFACHSPGRAAVGDEEPRRSLGRAHSVGSTLRYGCVKGESSWWSKQMYLLWPFFPPDVLAVEVQAFHGYRRQPREALHCCVPVFVQGTHGAALRADLWAAPRIPSANCWVGVLAAGLAPAPGSTRAAAGPSAGSALGSPRVRRPYLCHLRRMQRLILQVTQLP